MFSCIGIYYGRENAWLGKSGHGQTKNFSTTFIFFTTVYWVTHSFYQYETILILIVSPMYLLSYHNNYANYILASSQARYCSMGSYLVFQFLALKRGGICPNYYEHNFCLKPRIYLSSLSPKVISLSIQSRRSSGTHNQLSNIIIDTSQRWN